jgi:hypothetical protein
MLIGNLILKKSLVSFFQFLRIKESLVLVFQNFWNKVIYFQSFQTPSRNQ